MKSVILICVLLCLSINTASSAIITHGDYIWDNSTNYVVGPDTEWLRFTETQGMTVPTALSAYSHDGWTLASNSQIADLFSDWFPGAPFIWDSNENTSQNFSIPFQTGDDPGDPERLFITMFGQTSSHSGLSDDGFLTSAIFGEDSDGDGLINSLTVRDDYDSWFIDSILLTSGLANINQEGYTLDGSSYDEVPYSYHGSHRDHGIALVRAGTSASVYSPATLVLLFTGTVIISIRRAIHHLFTGSHRSLIDGSPVALPER